MDRATGELEMIDGAVDEGKRPLRAVLTCVPQTV